MKTITIKITDSQYKVFKEEAKCCYPYKTVQYVIKHYLPKY